MTDYQVAVRSDGALLSEQTVSVSRAFVPGLSPFVLYSVSIAGITSGDRGGVGDVVVLNQTTCMSSPSDIPEVALVEVAQ